MTDFNYFHDSGHNATQYSIDEYRVYRVLKYPTALK